MREMVLFKLLDISHPPEERELLFTLRQRRGEKFTTPEMETET